MHDGEHGATALPGTPPSRGYEVQPVQTFFLAFCAAFDAPSVASSGHKQRHGLATGAPGGDGAFVGEVARDAALVALPRPADEAGVEDEAVLGRVAPGLQSPVSNAHAFVLLPERVDDSAAAQGRRQADVWPRHL